MWYIEISKGGGKGAWMDNPIMEVHYSEYEVLALQSLSLRFPLKYSRRLPKSQHATRGVQGRRRRRRRRQGRGQNREDLSRLDRGRSFPLPTFHCRFISLFAIWRRKRNSSYPLALSLSNRAYRGGAERQFLFQHRGAAQWFLVLTQTTRWRG